MPNFQWHPNGPIDTFFRQQVQNQFFDSSFTGQGEYRLVKNGNISLLSQQHIAERLNAIGELFEEVRQEELRKPDEEKEGTTMVLAIRQWEFQAFVALERKKPGGS